jgi:hypothetical protein
MKSLLGIMPQLFTNLSLNPDLLQPRDHASSTTCGALNKAAHAVTGASDGA